MYNLTNRQKLLLLNTLPVIDSAGSNGELEYVLVANNEETSKTLALCDVSADYIKHITNDDDTLDVTQLGWDFGAVWFEPKYGGFINEEPELHKIKMEITIESLKKDNIHKLVDDIRKEIEKWKNVWDFEVKKIEKINER